MSEPIENVKITMTLPAVVVNAMDKKGWPFGMSGGVAFKLEPVELPQASPELPLEG